MKIPIFSSLNKTLKQFLSVYKGITGTIILIMYVASLNFATAEIEDEIAETVTEGVGDLVDKLSEDIDFTQDNFLNVTKQETEDIKDSGQEVMEDTITLFLSVKNFAKDGVKLISPYEISEFLLGIIAFAFAVVFILSILKAIGKHVLIMLLIGLSIVTLFVFLGL